MKAKRCLLLLAFVSTAAAAEGDPDTLLGAAMRSRPTYDGSKRQTTDVIPVLRYYGSALFARTTHGILEGGARFALPGDLIAGAQLAYEPGPRDGDPGASLGAHLEWSGKAGPVPVIALLRLRDQLDSERGAQLDARLTAGLYEGGGLRAGAFGQVSWADEKHFAAYYDVRDSGVLFTNLGVLGSYALGRRWLAVASAEVRRLADAPARSAFVQDRTARHVSAGLAYRF
jgi:outer membrane scaffolding protein for murein synthesis (MipA/OmpV family)